jgi:threonine dehydratase
MSATLEPVRSIELSEIRQARNRIAKTIVRTPLVRLEPGPDQPDVRLKLENLQPINAYKLRGAANAVAMLPESERERGVWTISAGNAGHVANAQTPAMQELFDWHWSMIRP